MSNHDGYKSQPIEYVSASVVLEDESLTVIKDIRILYRYALFVQILSDTTDLDQFVISARAQKSGAWSVLYSTPTDYTTPEGVLIGASSDLTTLPAGTRGWFLLYPSGFDAIRIEAARLAGPNTNLTLTAGVR